MQTLNQSAESPDKGTFNSSQRAEVNQALLIVLDSQPFRTSRQCRAFLQYIVEHSLDGSGEDLRERILGVEVFGRASDYDTAEDPVVRMRAADVRKRLAQFYQAASAQPLQIEVKPGSYRASFQWSDGMPAVEVAPPATSAQTAHESLSDELSDQSSDVASSQIRGRQTTLRIWAVSIAFALVAILICGFLWAGRSGKAQARFWAPVVRGKQPILLYLDANAAYRFTPDYLSRYQSDHALIDQNGPEFFPELAPGSTIRSEDLTPVKGTFTSGNDAIAAVRVALLLNKWSRPFTLRFADELAMSDLRNTPAVFIGGFNNHWTLESTKSLPLTLKDGVSIVDRADSGLRWTVDPNDRKTTKDDYALVSRVWSSTTGGPVVSLAGIGSFGTQAAAEFVCSPDRMTELLRLAPPQWNGENLQVVLRIHVVDYQPVEIQVAATRFW